MSRRLLATSTVSLAALALGACGGGGKSAQRSTGGAAGKCAKVSAPAPKAETLKRPALRLSRSDRLVAVVGTNCGSFEISLDTRRSPKTASSFAYLARKGFYDDTAFHRIVPMFVIQGGDPKGDGTGGPGYSVVESPPRSVAYTRGVVAMAKTGAEAPGTSGSQFYVVTAADAGLPSDYALLGKVTKGLDVVERIGRLGDPASGQTGTPLQTVVIERVRIRPA